MLDPIDTAQWYPTLMRKDYKIAMNVTETAVDDPDLAFYENYVCGAQRNYTGYCNPEVDKLIDQQSAETDIEKRKQLVWEIETKLIEDDARPILFYTARRQLPAAAAQGADHDGQQHLQSVALRGSLARAGGWRANVAGRSPLTFEAASGLPHRRHAC